MYVKHPTIDGDGVVNVALPDGSTKELKMVEGIIDWPENVPLHSSFKPAPEPVALRELKRQEKEEKMRALAAELGFSVDQAPAESHKASTKKTDKKAE